MRCVGSTTLKRDVKDVAVLHDSPSGVVVVAVTYEAPYSNERSNKTGSRNGASSLASSSSYSPPSYFTIIELDAPNPHSAPLRVLHVSVPGRAITKLALLPSRAAAGKSSAVQVIVQCLVGREGEGHNAEGKEEEASECDAAEKTATYLFRRIVETTDVEEGITVSSAGLRDEVDSTRFAEPRVCVHYEQLPRTVEDGGRVWTAIAVCAPPADGTLAPLQGAAGAGEEQYVLAASHRGAGESAMKDGVGVRANVVQVLAVRGARATIQRSVQVPGLAQLEVEEIVPIPGTSERALVRCHHAIVEVLLTGKTGSSVVGRIWRWTPHDRLTACCLRDNLLYAGTEEGVVLVWDTRSGMMANSNSDRVLISRSAASGVPLCGLHAPYSTDFVSCSMDGAVQAWGYSDQQQQQQQKLLMDSGMQQRVGGLSDFPRASAAAVVGGCFPYVPVMAPEAATRTGAEGCAAMGGDGNIVAVGEEYGGLRIYWCD